LIDETDETNNERSITISITEVETNPDEWTSIDTESDSFPIMMVISILIGGGAVALYMFGPRKIQRTHHLPTRRPKNR
jgi:subtilase family serine protease